MSENRHEVRRQGLGVSPGIAFGRAYLIGRDTLKAPRHHIELDDVDTEVARLYKAIAASDKQLARIKERLASENESDYHIITAHQMMLHDEHLVGAAVGYIRGELINAEWGLRRAVDDIAGVFDRMQDDYLRERRSDVEFVFERVLRSLLGRETGPVVPPPDAIVVAYDLSPADTAQLHKAAVAGMITDAGGKTSHTAIIARAHEIPAVVGLENITELVETDDRLLIDGGSGIVIVNPTPSTVAEFRDEQRRQVAAGAALHAMRDLPGVTVDGADIELMCNIDGPDEIEDALDYGAMGVGLFRTEYLFMNRADQPDEERHLPDRGRRAAPARRQAGDDPDLRPRRRQAGAVPRAGRPPGGQPRARPALDPAVPVAARPADVQGPAARPAARVGARPAQDHVPDDLGRRRAARGQGGGRRGQARAPAGRPGVRRARQARHHDRDAVGRAVRRVPGRGVRLLLDRHQ